MDTRRLTSKCFSYALANKAAGHFQPYQMGVAVKGGLEALIHTTRQLVQEVQGRGEVLGDEGDDLLLLSLDLVNAFNMADRQEAFKEVEEVFPEILAWVLTCYKHQAVLIFGSTVIMSEAGFHQGDPLASLLFSLTLHPILKMIVQRLPNLPIQGWYLDDGGIAGNRRTSSAVDAFLASVRLEFRS